MFRMKPLLLLWLVGLAVVGTGAVPGHAEPSVELSGNRPLLVFVTQSNACECVRNLCVAGEQEVINFLGDVGATIRYERVDLAKNPEAGKTYRAVTLPVVILFDAPGQEIRRFDSFFTEDQLAAVWQQHLASQEGQP